jgi:hypothetical protein
MRTGLKVVSRTELDMRVYYDNVIASGRVTGDLSPQSEMAALHEIEAQHSRGVIKRVTSRESWREQGRTRDSERRARLESARAEVSVVQTDHVLLGTSTQMGLLGTTFAAPLVSDIVDPALFEDLKAIGLEDADARHFMYAVANECDRFLTLDPHFLDRATVLSARCPSIQVLTPLQLVQELQRQSNNAG